MMKCLLWPLSNSKKRRRRDPVPFSEERQLRYLRVSRFKSNSTDLILCSHVIGSHHYHRLHIAAVVRRQPRFPTPDEKNKLQRKRQRLLDRIEAHQKLMARYIVASNDDNPSGFGWEDDQRPEFDNIAWVDFEGDPSEIPPEDIVEQRVEDPDGPIPPERIPLSLPSALGHAECVRRGLRPLVDLELKLRVGQCNDQLHKCRYSIAHKSYIYRTGRQHVPSVIETGRSWDEIHAVEGSLAQHARCYSVARRAMERLNAPDELLRKYKVLKREDLKASKAVVDPTARGQRNAGLPWLWTIDVPEEDADNPDSDWFRECTHFSEPPLGTY